MATTLPRNLHRPFDPDIFRQYLLHLLPPMLGANVADLNSLFDHEFGERVSRFAADTGGVIYVASERRKMKVI
jgi:hypothetical protein